MYQLEIHPDAEDEIFTEAKKYREKFSTGEEDFIMAISDTLEEIEKWPHSGQKRFPERDPNIRSKKVKAKKGTKAYAKQFPFVMIYKVYEEEQTILTYQLWPVKSGKKIRRAPK